MLLIIAALVAGGIAAGGMPIEVMPNINIPEVDVVTTYPGASTQAVLSAVTVPLETAVQGISGISDVNSTSEPGVSILAISLHSSASVSRTQQAIQTAVDAASLPPAANRPTVQQLSYSDIPVVQLIVTGKSAYQLGNATQNTLVPTLSGLTGVGGVNVSGARQSQVLVTLSLAKLTSKGVPLASVEQALSGNTLTAPIGTAQVSGREVPIVVQSGLSRSDIEQMPVQTLRGGSVTIGQLGTVAVTAQGQGDVISHGHPAALVNVQFAAGANTVAVANEVLQKLPSLRRSLPQGDRITVLWNSADTIETSVQAMLHEGLLGVVFAVVIIFLFLRSARTTLVAIVSIPLSIFVALYVLGSYGYTLNLMTLGGLAVAVGRVVDDSIVVIENLYRRFQGTEPGKAPVVSGTGEVARAITTSTVTTIAVFAPLGLVSGMVGRVFMPFALSVVVSLAASLLVALMVVPLLSRSLLGRRPPKPERTSRLTAVYRRLLGWGLRHRAVTLAVAAALFLGSLGVAAGLPQTLLPNSGPNILDISLTLPVGTARSVTRTVLTRLERTVAADKSVAKEAAVLGGGSGASGQNVSTDNTGIIFAVLQQSADGQAAQNDLQKALRREVGRGTTVEVQGTSAATGSANTISIHLTGPSRSALLTPSRQVEAIMRRTAGLTAVSNDLTSAERSLSVQLLPAAAMQHGVNGQALVQQLAPFFSPVTVANLEMGATTVPLRLSVPVSPRNLSAFGKLPLMGSQGPLALSEVAHLAYVSAPLSINRLNSRTVATISADVTGQDLGGITASVLRQVQALHLPASISVQVGGSSNQMSTAFTQLGYAMIAAILLVYLIMVVAFGNMRAPLAILFSLPLALIGAILGLYLTKNALGIPALIGLLMLIGIVVTNAIVLLDFVYQKWQGGQTLHRALIDAGATRLRPILMTAFTSIFALLPLALGYGNGLIISSSLAVVVIGGLLTSTLLTLLVVPVALSVLTGGDRPRAQDPLADV